jgi:hypothetical protein
MHTLHGKAAYVQVSFNCILQLTMPIATHMNVAFAFLRRSLCVRACVRARVCVCQAAEMSSNYFPASPSADCVTKNPAEIQTTKMRSVFDIIVTFEIITVNILWFAAMP